MLAAGMPTCPPCPFTTGTELSARLQSHVVLVKPMQMSSAPENPVCPSPPLTIPAFSLLAWQGPTHSSPRGESVQGNEPAGNYLLVWDVFCWLSSPNQLPAEGGQVPPAGWMGMPMQAWGRPSGLKIQRMSHTWRDTFLPHPPYPMAGRQ